MKRLRVRFRPRANQDIKDIYDWIVTNGGTAKVAERLIDRLIDRAESLAEFPLKGRARDDLQSGIRIVPFERTAVIAYRVQPDEVEIVSIFYRGRDYEAALLEDSLDSPPPVE